MLENIKSSYFLKILFNHLNDALKLNLLKYNKNLQSINNISLINFKFFSGKYIIYEEERKGKIYNAFNNILIYEGELLNGKKNGKGKEYGYNGDLIFEGEFLNGKRVIKGKENKFKEGYVYQYNTFNILIFEGEYLNGRRNGKGKEYYENGDLKFEGEYLNGQLNGKGKEYYGNGKLKFDGEFFYGKKWKGILFDMNNNIIGEILKGKGYIKEYDFFSHKIDFEGDYLNGKRNRKGKVIKMEC